MILKDKLANFTSQKFGVCVGLDPVLEKLPSHLQNSTEAYFDFCSAIVEETIDYASAYKLNFAFFEVLGESGWLQLRKLVRMIPEDKLIIGDAKRGDIGNTAKAYSKALFKTIGVDMATVSPYLGGDTLEPFLEDEKHGVFVLAVTSNPGSFDLQNLMVDGRPLYHHVISMVRRVNKSGNAGLVVGATKPEVLAPIADIAVDMPLLIPGIGAQGGDMDALKRTLKDYKGAIFVNSSRGIIYADSTANFAKAAGKEAKKLQEQLNSQV